MFCSTVGECLPWTDEVLFDLVTGRRVPVFIADVLLGVLDDPVLVVPVGRERAVIGWTLELPDHIDPSRSDRLGVRADIAERGY